MENENVVVNNENQTPQVTNAEIENTKEPASSVIDTVNRNVYETVVRDMKKERELKREAKSEVEELKKRIEELEKGKDSTFDDEEEKPLRDPRIDVLYLATRDPFVRDNIDLIEQKMSENKRLDIHSAVKEIKADILDRIEREIYKSSNNTNQITEKPTATRQEPSRVISSGDKLKDVMDGKSNLPPEMIIALKRKLG